MAKIRIIAEPANYWHGDINLLQALLMESCAAQADFFKIQVYNSNHLGNKFKHQKERYKSMEITSDTLGKIKTSCDKYGIKLLATVNTCDRVDLLKSQDVNNVKIASGQIHPLLIQAISQHKWERVFVSTGMVEDYDTLVQIEELAKCADEVVIMHCVSLYPTHDSEVNLSRITLLYQNFPWASIGYSDHQMDDLACMVAMGFGATYIEKHIAVEQCFGPTCEISANMEAFSRICAVRKRIERMWGDGTLACQPREKESMKHYRGRYLLDG